jgi:hypothetical protein
MALILAVFLIRLERAQSEVRDIHESAYLFFQVADDPRRDAVASLQPILTSELFRYCFPEKWLPSTGLEGYCSLEA